MNTQNRNLTLLRLNKQEKQLNDDPIPGVIIRRQGTYNFHFCFYKLDGAYEGGYYHGMFQIPQAYPFKAPKLIFYTPSGRFDVGIPICTTFTNYHQQSWTSAWNIQTMAIATMSFMTGDQFGYGCTNTTDDQKRQLAKNSLNFNLENKLFKSLFGNKLRKLGVFISGQILPLNEENNMIEQLIISEEPLRPQAPQDGNNRRPIIFLLYGTLVAAIVVWAYIKLK